jgi:hypothetical protein
VLESSIETLEMFQASQGRDPHAAQAAVTPVSNVVAYHDEEALAARHENAQDTGQLSLS